ncbi:uncharacterized protein RAG0_02932 [Rhynchosporium agropyri]|uniref:Uncharacterized protein n=1 Tax=Rhynchosporium agropyri TaxID=914238 RepID=A0A1E1K357_9HELO|nr:uncharacterized protein RAG0_02932 [Rhynchosporium agropyri]
MAACPIVHHAVRGSSIIREIMNVQLLPGFTIYDILRLPMYETYDRHVSNEADLSTELALPGCTCPNQAVCIAAVNAAWALISADAATKNAYDLALNAILPPLATSIPQGELAIRTRPRKMRPRDGVPYDSRRSREFAFVAYWPRGIWRKLWPNGLMNRRIETSFWTAISRGMTGDERHWAEIKALCEAEWLFIMAPTPPFTPIHPRKGEWGSLDNAATERGLVARGLAPAGPIIQSRIPSFPIAEQLAADIDVSGQPGVYQGHHVTSEAWPIVADALRIEIIMITEEGFGGDGHRGLVPRGYHGNQQVFIWMGGNGEYFAVEPIVDDPEDFRYTKHLLSSMPSNLPGRITKTSTPAERKDHSNKLRCPLVATDVWDVPRWLGDYKHRFPTIAPVGITNITPAIPSLYPGPFQPLEQIQYIGKAIQPPEANVLRHLNTGGVPRRWV